MKYCSCGGKMTYHVEYIMDSGDEAILCVFEGSFVCVRVEYSTSNLRERGILPGHNLKGEFDKHGFLKITRVDACKGGMQGEILAGCDFYQPFVPSQF